MEEPSSLEAFATLPDMESPRNPRDTTQPGVTMMGKTMAADVDLTIQSRPRQASWMAVKRWTLLRGTCLKSRRSGWCFAGISNSCTLFVN